MANLQKPALDVVTTAVVDLVFGTGYNGMAAATYKAVTTNAQNRTSNNSNNAKPSNSGVKGTGVGDTGATSRSQRGAQFVCIAY